MTQSEPQAPLDMMVSVTHTLGISPIKLSTIASAIPIGLPSLHKGAKAYHMLACDVIVRHSVLIQTRAYVYPGCKPKIQ